MTPQQKYARDNPKKIKESQHKWYVANKEKSAANGKKWKLKNPEKAQALHEKYRQKNLTYHAKYMRAWRRKQLIAPPPYEPPEHCEACGRPLLKPNLDHCHITNRFRGWLCNPCNAALGLAGDTPEGVRRLLEYIIRTQAMLDLQLLE